MTTADVHCVHDRVARAEPPARWTVLAAVAYRPWAPRDGYFPIFRTEPTS
jgi:hypothetical protein